MSSVISSHSPDAVSQAVSVLNAGGLVGLPTETVYGLAARADLDNAVEHIFRAKGRPAGHPLILHISDISELNRYAVNIPNSALQLAQHCWPGPLTLLLEKTNAVSHRVTGGRDGCNSNSSEPVCEKDHRAMRKCCCSAICESVWSRQSNYCSTRTQ